jgi:hypothetical protein
MTKYWSNQAQGNHQPCIAGVSRSLAKRRSCVIRHQIHRHLSTPSPSISPAHPAITYHNFTPEQLQYHFSCKIRPGNRENINHQSNVRVEPFQHSFHSSVWNHGRNTRSRQYANIRFRTLRTLSSGHSSCQADLDQERRATIGIG